jgi:hypothetical protein
MKRVAAALLLLIPVSAHAQQTPTMFSCIEADRVRAGTFEYVVKAGREYKDYWIVAPVDVEGRSILRVVFRRTRENTTTSEATSDFDAASFQQLAFRHMRDPNGPDAGAIADLRIADDRLTGATYGGDTISLATKGEPVLFGGVAADPLAPLVDWERCPTVHAQKLKGSELAAISYTRVGEGTLTVGGQERAVHEIVKHEGEYQTRLFITKSAPFVVVKIESGMGVSELAQFPY